LEGVLVNENAILEKSVTKFGPSTGNTVSGMLPILLRDREVITGINNS
jgi:hypothetical protein